MEKCIIWHTPMPQRKGKIAEKAIHQFLWIHFFLLSSYRI
nr:MAG TPA_asm: hypothetical protein [Caudoviricetes sp.]